MDFVSISQLASAIKHKQRHGDMVIFPEKDLPSHILDSEIDQLCKELKCNRLATFKKISDTDFRIPVVTLRKGVSTTVEHKDNGVIYRFDVTKCMFSFGNISEKLRVSKLDCTDETIVDLFCGIGYFTLQFLVHCRAQVVHACDWNPNAIEALRESLKANKVENKCVIHFGDNRETCPVGIADRVYLGLIPTSRGSWRTACAALKPSTGGVLHIHDNVSTYGSKDKLEREKVLTAWQEDVVSELATVFENLYKDRKWSLSVKELTKVKSYAPHIHHFVLDVDCRPGYEL